MKKREFLKKYKQSMNEINIVATNIIWEHTEPTKVPVHYLPHCSSYKVLNFVTFQYFTFWKILNSYRKYLAQ